MVQDPALPDIKSCSKATVIHTVVLQMEVQTNSPNLLNRSKST